MSSKSSSADILETVARNAMIEHGLYPDFTSAALKEAAQMSALLSSDPAAQDMREIPWISIDNDDSKDLDQLTYAEEKAGDFDVIYVAIADVNSLVKKNSAIDSYAGHNTTSVYTPTKVFPMLPLKLSNDLTSLNEQQEREAIVVKVNISQEGAFSVNDVFAALVKNHAKLTYNKVADFLENDTYIPLPKPIVDTVHSQLKIQDRIAQRIKKYRYRQGALSFGTIEYKPIMQDGTVTGLEETFHSRSNKLIENFMIAANVAMTGFMQSRNLPTLRRIVRTPERWDRIVDLASTLGGKLPDHPDAKTLQAFLTKQRQSDPLHFPDLSLAMIKLIGNGEYVVGFPGKEAPGHFDLALQEYAHTTAPNRRYPDLVMQRILKSYFAKAPLPYNDAELESIAQACTEMEDAATKVERRARKSAAAMVLSDQIGKRFDAIVTGASEKGTWVRLLNPPIEGKLVRGFNGLDVGDQLTVKLLYVDIMQGFIDFARV